VSRSRHNGCGGPCAVCRPHKLLGNRPESTRPSIRASAPRLDEQLREIDNRVDIDFEEFTLIGEHSSEEFILFGEAATWGDDEALAVFRATRYLRARANSEVLGALAEHEAKTKIPGNLSR
jgi:hypothetical protein